VTEARPTAIWHCRSRRKAPSSTLPPGRQFTVSTSFPFFWPRGAMHKRGLCRHAVSVCLSVTFVDHVKTNKLIFEFFSPSGSHTILVFPYQTGWRYSHGNPPNGGVECRLGIGRNRVSGLIAGYRRLLVVRRVSPHFLEYRNTKCSQV